MPNNEPSTEKMEKFVMMVINALGMLENRLLDLESRISRFEDWSREVTEAFNSYNVCLNDLAKQLELNRQSYLSSNGLKTSVNKDKKSPIEPKPNICNQALSSTIDTVPSISASSAPTSSSKPPDEHEISAFRSKILKPIPKNLPDRPKQPTSIRAALIQEMKEFFGLDKKKEEEKENSSK
ncbi:MAG: hypothetical protein ACTSRP_26570 [Candidatus Helarchaeota archaeon]